MTKRFDRVWISPEAKREAKKKAADMNLGLHEFFDDLLLGRRKGRGGFDSFF